MPLFKVKCIGQHGEDVVEEVDTENPLVAVGACRMKGLFPMRFLGTPEEEEALAARLNRSDDPLWLAKLCEAQGTAFQTLELIQQVMEERPDLKPLLTKHHTYLQLAQLIESLRALTDDAREQFPNVPAETR